MRTSPRHIGTNEKKLSTEMASSGRAQLAAEVRGERNHFNLVRGSIVTLLAVLTLFMSSGSPMAMRLIASLGLALGIVPLQYVADIRLDPDKNMLAQAALAHLGAALVATAVPSLWHPAMIVAALVSVDNLKSKPSVDVAGLMFTLVTMSISGIIGSVPGWYLSIIAYALLRSLRMFMFLEQRTQEAEVAARHDALITEAGVFVWEVAASDLKIRAITGNTAALLGWSAEELVGRDWTDILHPDGRSLLGPTRALKPGDDLEVVVPLQHRDGSSVAFRHRVHLSPDGELYSGAATEISELAKATETIRYQADHDALTGMANRRLLLQVLGTELSQRDVGVVGLLMVDLNRFKEVNDVLGHATGDELLKILAQRFERVDARIKARIGGDEFAFVVVARTSEGVQKVAREVSVLLNEPVRLRDLKLSSSGAIGIAIAPDHADTSSDLMQFADVAMYQAKTANENMRMYVPSADQHAVERLTLSVDVRRAVQSDEFELFFQPKVNLITGAIEGAEGLARWCHPSKGVLGPGHFLELLVLTGEYNAFSAEMLAQGIEFASRCQRADPNFEVAVNLSSASFFDRELPQRIRTLLEIHNVEPSQLTLEITESDILEEPDKALPVFEELRELGLGLSIDDFGTGYSSLARLRRLPVTEVKIDRSFVSNLATEPDDFLIARTVIELGSVLDRRVVAEGVETEEIAEILRSMGCIYAQGYLYAKALPAEEFVDRLTAGWRAFDPADVLTSAADDAV